MIRISTLKDQKKYILQIYSKADGQIKRDYVDTFDISICVLFNFLNSLPNLINLLQSPMSICINIEINPFKRKSTTHITLSIPKNRSHTYQPQSQRRDRKKEMKRKGRQTRTMKVV